MSTRSKKYPEELQSYLKSGMRVCYARNTDTYYIYNGYPVLDPATGRKKVAPNTLIGHYREDTGFLFAEEINKKRSSSVPSEPIPAKASSCGTEQQDASVSHEPDLCAAVCLPDNRSLSVFSALMGSCLQPELSAASSSGTRSERRRKKKEERKQMEKLSRHTEVIMELVAKANVQAEVLKDLDAPGSERYQQEAKKLEDIRSMICTEAQHLGKNAYAVFILLLLRQILAEMADNAENRDKFFSNSAAFKRNRKVTLYELVCLLMTAGALTLDRAVFRHFYDTGDIPTASAICQQRAKLKPEGVKYLFNRLTEQLTPPSLKLWKGKYRILAVDGSDTNIAYNEESDTFTPGAVRGNNQFHVNCAYDVLNGLFCSVLVQPRGKMNECGAVVSMLRNIVLRIKTIWLGDRGYGSLNLFETLRRTENADYVIRVREDYIKEIKALPLEELDTHIRFKVVTRQTKKNKEDAGKGLCKILSGESRYGKYKKNVEWEYEDGIDVDLRVVRFLLSSGKWETLVTSLSEEEFPIESLKELYAWRWKEELAFRSLKYSISLSCYHSRKEEYNEQEIYASLCAYNICSVLIAGAETLDLKASLMDNLFKVIPVSGLPEDEPGMALPETNPEKDGEAPSSAKERKYPYRLNRTMGIYIILDFIRNRGDVPYDLYEMLRRYRVPVRKGRKFPRNMRTHSFVDFQYRFI